ncbi:acetyl-CoA carboxylase biotin carboxyl carrier protein subunit [Pediococcus acidilactici]|uniref:acetyl-CoA carboxylase biotin carboxyl carrier protein n=1 Tax=Pediococcus acidilactici TaxID=1254 RepID=UPI002F263883
MNKNKVNMEDVFELFKTGTLHKFKYNDGNTYIEINSDQDILKNENEKKEKRNGKDNTTEKDTKEQFEDEKNTIIKSPTVGIFYSREKPGDPVLASVGNKVNRGDVVGLIEAMKMFSEVKSPSSGTITKVLVSDNETVEFNQPLFVVDPNK